MPPLWRLAWPALALMAACIGIEAALSLADAGWIGSLRWRALSWQEGAFWPGLLTSGWQANYPGQRLAMFFSHGLLHAGPGHLAGNMTVIGLLLPGLARGLAPGAPWRLALLWLLCQIGGALGFMVLHPGPQPMIGASGVAFGLAASQQMLLALAELREGARRRAGGRIVVAVLLLLAVNAASWLMRGGQLAWEAHLGGMLAGLVATPLLAPAPEPVPTPEPARHPEPGEAAGPAQPRRSQSSSRARKSGPTAAP